MRVILALAIAVIILAGVSLFPVRDTERANFATPGFHRAWQSEPASAARSLDLWGSEPLLWRVEPYIGAPNDRRVVQYFERGRMEQNSGSNTVTHGLLARELTSGQVNLGDGHSFGRQPPEISVDSGDLDPEVPTYLTLSRVVGERAADRSRGNQRITSWIYRGGTYESGSPPEEVIYAEFVSESGHNLPDVTVDLFAQPEFADDRWIDVFGFPISEPYWTTFRKNEETTTSLIQVFERRILVYTPGQAFERTFSVANSGRHYLIWRYGRAPDADDPPESKVAGEPGFVHDDDVSVSAVATDIGTPIDLELSVSGHLLVLTREGNVYRSSALDPYRTAGEFTLWASGIPEPIGIVRSGARVLITTGEGARWYEDVDGVGDLDESMSRELAPDGVSSRPGSPLRTSYGEVLTHDVSRSGEEYLRAIGSSEPLYMLSELVYQPGPVAFSDRELFLTGVLENDRAAILNMAINGQNGGDASPLTLMSFPPQTKPTAIAIADEPLWSITSLGHVFISISGDDGSRIYALALSRPDTPNELVEIAAGFNDPRAMLFGLDGSLYVADADRGAVFRISYTGD